MLKRSFVMLATLALLSACAPMTPPLQTAGSARVEGAPGKAVVYVVRTNPDLSYLTATIVFDDTMIGSTHAGTYFRIEAAPGRHRISGYAEDNGSMVLDLQPDRVYFIQHTVSGSWRATNPHSFFSVMDEGRARAAIARSIPAG